MTVNESTLNKSARTNYAPYDLDGRPLPLVAEPEQTAESQGHPSFVSRSFGAASLGGSTSTVAGQEGQEGTALPMLIYLNGSEPFFEEFCLEADDVMQILGIKRSRLTQISGRELRVGRVRRGRYISPTYREADVMEYLNWSRATATQSKNAAILHDAAQAMLDEAGRLNLQLSQLLQSSLKKQNDEFSSQLHRTSTWMREAISSQNASIQNALREQGEQLKRATYKLHDDLVCKSEELQQELASQKSAMTSFHATITEVMQQLLTKLVVSQDQLQTLQEQNLQLATQVETLSQRLDSQMQLDARRKHKKQREPARHSARKRLHRSLFQPEVSKEPQLAKMARRIKNKAKL